MHDMAAEQFALVRVEEIKEGPLVMVEVAEGGGAFAAGGGGHWLDVFAVGALAATADAPRGGGARSDARCDRVKDRWANHRQALADKGTSCYKETNYFLGTYLALRERCLV
mmetsp:Transcript_17912/g.35736  ORF Transcript_17912/g.35736 Transcript_17912/m.35736 type:complete len:111 (+) Transcript_17912:65-397(+)